VLWRREQPARVPEVNTWHATLPALLSFVKFPGLKFFWMCGFAIASMPTIEAELHASLNNVLSDIAPIKLFVLSKTTDTNLAVRVGFEPRSY
jgi:hypothetical protein